MTRNHATLSFAAIIVALIAVTVTHPWEGPVVLTLTRDHGVHSSDLVVLFALLALLGWIWRPSRRPN